MPDDGAIIAASKVEPELFSTVFDRHYAAVHRYLARRAGSQVADDLASLTFVVALERRGSFREDAPDARPWLYGIATNLLRNYARDERRRHQVDRALLDDGSHQSTATPQDAADDEMALAQALQRLDADQRDVLLLYAWAELSYEEIASSLSIPTGTVRSRLARARARLRSALEAPPVTADLEAPTTVQEER